MWDEEDGFFYDQLIAPDGTIVARQGPLDGRRHPAARSDRPIDQELIDRAKVLGKGVARLLDRFGGIDGLAEHGLRARRAGSDDEC